MGSAFLLAAVGFARQDAHKARTSLGLNMPRAPAQAVHAWPDNWQVSGADFMTNWVNCHIAASASLGKPMILEEVQAARLCCQQTHSNVYACLPL